MLQKFYHMSCNCHSLEKRCTSFHRNSVCLGLVHLIAVALYQASPLGLVLRMSCEAVCKMKNEIWKQEKPPPSLTQYYMNAVFNRFKSCYWSTKLSKCNGSFFSPCLSFFHNSFINKNPDRNIDSLIGKGLLSENISAWAVMPLGHYILLLDNSVSLGNSHYCMDSLGFTVKTIKH